eukprot:g1559.t1
MSVEDMPLAASVAFYCSFDNRGKCREGDKCKFKHHPCSNVDTCDDQSCQLGHSAERKAWCVYYRTGKCTAGTECPFKHQDCQEGKGCENPTCQRGHPDSWTQGRSSAPSHKHSGKPGEGTSLSSGSLPRSPSRPQRQTTDGGSGTPSKPCKSPALCWNPRCSFKHDEGWKACTRGRLCTDSMCNATVHPPGRAESVCPDGVDCLDFECKELHPRERPRTCLSSSTCYDLECKFLHSDKRQVCEEGASCDNVNCKGAHPASRPPACNLRDQCRFLNCKRFHPASRPAICSEGADCKTFACEHLHPSGRPRPCSSKTECFRLDCKFLHPAGRVVCQRDCALFDCKKAHPAGRKRACKAGLSCHETKCKYLHPKNHHVCHIGVACDDPGCTGAHPNERPLVCQRGAECPLTDCEFLHPLTWDPEKVQKEATEKKKQGVIDGVKSQDMRDADRKAAGLPILKCKEEFLVRLQQERVLVVIAETGSGKTTQLPQYCAEAFGGLVVCTQPRVIAAVSIAKRVALEFDGTSVGHNVGYKVGGSGASNGQLISFMTDSTFVREATRDPLMKQVKVLVIDEAHERSLYTDLVVGIAKLILKERSDFHVVIASATIDPRPFLEFFFESPFPPAPLKVRGRVFPVTSVTIPCDADANVLRDTLIPQVVKAMEDYEEGHCLVFCPGSKEIDVAIKQFRSVAEENWIALPLYGSLPAEEQERVTNFDSEGGTLRMVVFCTNIAETSLTIDGVRIVVDTGLAKEARFDPVRRMTILEQVLVSRSSANQRKGRAGRTAEGVCIRLFDFDELERDNIVPEIMRSSLELVVLQLRCLGYDPLQFPFVDRPPESQLTSSIELLKHLGCLEKESGKITSQGRTFSELPFDPRLSYFVVKAQTEYQMGNLAATIAAILTAPGSLFFMGGSQPGGRDQAKRRVAELASQHRSDLLFLESIFSDWVSSGDLDVDGKCFSCKKKILARTAMRDGGCRWCRSKHAKKECLNNKTLDIVRQTVQKVMDAIEGRSRRRNLQGTTKGKPSQKEMKLSEEKVDRHTVVSRCLLESFQDQLAEVMMQTNLDAGVHLLNSSLRGRFSNTSSFSQRNETKTKFLVVLGVMQLPKGGLIVDMVHPIDDSDLGEQNLATIQAQCVEVVECFKTQDLSARYAQRLERLFNPRPPRGASRDGFRVSSDPNDFVSIVHNLVRTTLSVFGPKKKRQEIKDRASKEVLKMLDEDWLTETKVLTCKSTAVTVLGAGFNVLGVESVKIGTKVVFENPPASTEEDLKAWILHCTRGKPTDIDFARLSSSTVDGRSTKAFVVFRSPELAQAAIARTGCSETSRDDSDAKSESQKSSPETVMGRLGLSREEEAGQSSILRLAGERKEKDVRAELLKKGWKVLTVIRTFVDKGLVGVKCNNLPAATTENQFQEAGVKTAKVRLYPPKNNTRGGVLFFNSDAERTLGLKQLQRCYWATNEFSINIVTKQGRSKTKLVRPEFNLMTQGRETRTEFQVTFATQHDADTACSNPIELLGHQVQLSGVAKMKVQFPDLFPLSKYVQFAESRFQVKANIKTSAQQKLRGSKREQSATIIISNALPSVCGSAIRSLVAATKPLSLRFASRQTQVMGHELKQNGAMVNWAQELGLFIQFSESRGTKRKSDASVIGVSVHGPTTQQGAFMKKYNDYFDVFKLRFDWVHLSESVAPLFSAKRIGRPRLDELEKSFEDVSIRFDWKSSTVELLVNEAIDSDTAGKLLSQVKQNLQKITNELSSSDSQIELESIICTQCRDHCASVLRICGHAACGRCMARTIEDLIDQANHQLEANNETDEFAVGCPTCSQAIHMADIKQHLPQNDWTRACDAATKAFLISPRNSDVNLLLCPVQSCNGIMFKDKGYTRCTACNTPCCPICKHKGDSRHEGVPCDAFLLQVEAADREEKKKLEEEAALRKAEMERKMEQEAAEREEVRAKKLKLLEDQQKALELRQKLQQAFNTEDLKKQELELKAEIEKQRKQAEEEEQRAKEERLKLDIKLANDRIVDQIVQGAKKFLEENPDAGLGDPVAVDVNPGLGRNCPAMHRYCEGVKRAGGVDALSTKSLYAWHGTSDIAIPPICENGFDPGRRRGQAYGPGEYFGLSASISRGYIKGSTRLIVCQLLRVHEMHTSGSYCYVVNNPLDNSYCFNLPVLVVTYEQNTPLQFLPGSGASPISLIDPSSLPAVAKSMYADPTSAGTKVELFQEAVAWESPHCWEWRNDDGWKLYKDENNYMIEDAFIRWKFSGGTAVFRTPPIVRYVDDRPRVYEIDFINNRQTNTETGYMRQTRRVKNNILRPTNAAWEYLNEHSTWIVLESAVMGTVEQAFQLYVNAGGNSKIVVQPPGRPEQYEINFVHGTQQNLTAGTVRKVRRVATSRRPGIAASPVVSEASAADSSSQKKRELEEQLSRLQLLKRADEAAEASLARIQQDLEQLKKEEAALERVNTRPDWSDYEVLYIKLTDAQVQAALQKRDSLLCHMQDMIGRASSSVIESHRNWLSDSVRLSIDQSKLRVALYVRGVATTICALLLGHIAGELGLKGSANHVVANGDQGTQLVANPRLLHLATRTTSFGVAKDKDTAMLALAHAAIWKAACRVYGGFVRDWVVNGESAADIDVLMDEAPRKSEIVASLEEAAKAIGLTPVAVDQGHVRGAAYRMEFTSDSFGGKVRLDLTNPNSKEIKEVYQPPGVSSDVDNLCIAQDGCMYKKVLTAGGSMLPLSTCLEHCRQKEFVFFYDVSVAEDMCVKRLKKLLQKGYTCLSPLPHHITTQLENFADKGLLKPAKEYDCSWKAELSNSCQDIEIKRLPSSTSFRMIPTWKGKHRLKSPSPAEAFYL